MLSMLKAHQSRKQQASAMEDRGLLTRRPAGQSQPAGGHRGNSQLKPPPQQQQPLQQQQQPPQPLQQQQSQSQVLTCVQHSSRSSSGDEAPSAVRARKHHRWTSAQEQKVMQELKRADKALRHPDYGSLASMLGLDETQVKRKARRILQDMAHKRKRKLSTPRKPRALPRSCSAPQSLQPTQPVCASSAQTQQQQQQQQQQQVTDKEQLQQQPQLEPRQQQLQQQQQPKRQLSGTGASTQQQQQTCNGSPASGSPASESTQAQQQQQQQQKQQQKQQQRQQRKQPQQQRQQKLQVVRQFPGRLNPHVAQQQQQQPTTPTRSRPAAAVTTKEDTPLRQKIHELMAIVPGHRGTVGAVVEELMLEPPYASQDQAALKRRVAAIMSSGAEFVSSSAYQSRSNKRYEYEFQQQNALGVSIRGRKVR